MKLLIDSLQSPVGRFFVVVDEEGRLHAANFEAPEGEFSAAKNPGGVTGKPGGGGGALSLGDWG